ncbi:MAG: sodium:alanine symporter family protein [Desulfobulbaceae bacterium]|nr:sodium:alanine symporter family protein [Desulfobulbaceae bacterium]
MWGPFTVILLVGTGILTTVLIRGLQVRKLLYGFKLLSGKYEDPSNKGEITPFQALTAAMSATIGTGNIAGVGTAIALGGPGAVFWMWVTAFFGMGLKYSECLLSHKYRVIHDDGSISAGPMYYLEHGLGQKWLGIAFAFFATIASFGIGNMVQANSVAAPLHTFFNIPKLGTGIVIGVLVFSVIVGGIKRIGHLASRMVPAMALFYVVGACLVLYINLGEIPAAFGLIFQDAFTGTAATGGFAGAAVAQAVRFGVARGVFSNEAGLGSAPIAHGAAKTKEPVRQGVVSMLGPFIDTLVICTMTALVILTSGIWKEGLSGSDLTAAAFNAGLPGVGGYIVTFGIVVFAFSTAVSWSYYGDRSVEYLWGPKFIFPYRVLYCLLLPVGATVKLSLVWAISDIFNALMAWPNLIGLLFLSGVVVRSTKEYFSDPDRIKALH